MKKILLVAALMLICTGCVRFPTYSLPKPDQAVSGKSLEQAGEGAVLLSLTADLERGGEQVNGNVFYEGLSEASTSSGRFSLHGIQLLGPLGQQRHFEEVNGKLLIEKLEPGKYALTRWNLHNATGFIYSSKYPLEPLEFEVEAGEVIYIGNIHYVLSTGKNVFGMNITGGAWARHSDQQERDIALARKLFPNLHDVRVEKMKSHRWEMDHVMRRLNSVSE